MYGKQLANPAYPKMDTGLNPISLIKIGLIDPKDGIVAPNEPQLTMEKPNKLTTSEKLGYSIVTILIIGSLVAIITFRIGMFIFWVSFIVIPKTDGGTPKLVIITHQHTKTIVFIESSIFSY